MPELLKKKELKKRIKELRNGKKNLMKNKEKKKMN